MTQSRNFSRRGFLVSSLAAADTFIKNLGSRSSLLARADQNYLIVRGKWPQNLETPRPYFRTFFTPNAYFFVRSHFVVPPWIRRYPGWNVTLTGSVNEKVRLSLDEIRKMEKVSLPAVLQCSGNGRSLHEPTVPGIQWGHGAMGHAMWAGIRLRDILKLAGLNANVRHIQFEGADLPPLPKTPAYIRSIPIEKALDPNTVLAYEMNGEPLPHLHGGPLRLIVPGWAGDHWLKWVREITARENEAEGFYMQTAYKMPLKPVIPGSSLKLEEMTPVTTINVKSLITHPLPGNVIKDRQVEVSGIAFTGTGQVVRVSLSVDDGKTWVDTQLDPQASPGSWQQWRAQWRPSRSDRWQILSRATDSAGNTQPAVGLWNPSGYLWNAIDRVECEVQI